MASVVLAGLLYIFVELYLDDVLVYGTSDEEFLERLRIVFEGFRQFNITLNPKKCCFGLEEVEFIGHVLRSDGFCFSTEKRSKVLDFPLPVKQKQLKSFLGLVNYFRDHVRGLSHKVKPLNDVMIPYRKGTSIDWTPRLEECFRDVQESVGKCPKLFYVHLDLSVHVRTTDASDYGIGEYISQMDQQKEWPIRHISKALHKAQLNWSTFAKEAFSISRPRERGNKPSGGSVDGGVGRPSDRGNKPSGGSVDGGVGRPRERGNKPSEGSVNGDVGRPGDRGNKPGGGSVDGDVGRPSERGP